LKGILKFILGLVVLLLIVAIFIPKDYTVAVTNTINKPKQVVFDYAKMIKNQEKYSVWVMQDTTVAIVYKGVDGTVGASSSWNSKNDNVGEGQQEITAIKDGERIDVALNFKRPMESHDRASTTFKAISDNQTEVTSTFYGHSPYPMNLMSFVAKGFIRDGEAKNLENMKKILEK
jgi:hypothetical protein